MQDLPVDRDELLSYARHELGLHRLAVADAEDLVQDAFTAWCGNPAVADPGAYLRLTIRNLVVNQIRRESGRRRADPLEVAHLSLDEPWAWGGSLRPEDV